jgi:L-rhamnose mutarotase
MSETLERSVYIQRIDTDHREQYIDAHDQVPVGVTDAMRRGGVKEFELYVRGDMAVCILEAEDVDAYFDSIDGDAAVEEWERYVAQFKQEGINIDDKDETIPFMECIWTLSEGAKR